MSTFASNNRYSLLESTTSQSQAKVTQHTHILMFKNLKNVLTQHFSRFLNYNISSKHSKPYHLLTSLIKNICQKYYPFGNLIMNKFINYNTYGLHVFNICWFISMKKGSMDHFGQPCGNQWESYDWGCLIVFEKKCYWVSENVVKRWGVTNPPFHPFFSFSLTHYMTYCYISWFQFWKWKTYQVFQNMFIRNYILELFFSWDKLFLAPY